MAPVITVDPESQNVTVLGNITLTCQATAQPIPTITWFQNGVGFTDGEITGEGFDSQIFTSTLVITMAMVNDSGGYHCATNGSSLVPATSEVAIVLVQGKDQARKCGVLLLCPGYSVMTWLHVLIIRYTRATSVSSSCS